MLTGRALLTIVFPITQLSQFDLDLIKLNVTAVSINGNGVSFKQTADKLYISKFLPADTILAAIDYQGTPTNDGFGGFFFTDNSVFTIGQGINSYPPSMLRYWIPSHDEPWDKALLDLQINVPTPAQAFSNGELVSFAQEGNRNIFHWREVHPIAPYLIALAIGEYSTLDYPYRSISGDSLSIQALIFPHDVDKAKKDLKNLAVMMNFFETAFCPYPFSNYRMVEANNRGAMEHQTLTTFSNQLLTGDNQYEYIVAHELAHHWWGNYVTLADWKDIWLNEGFATYSEALYFESLYGGNYLSLYMEHLAEAYFAEVSRRGHFTVYNPAYLWGATVYQKGAWILHMLRWTIGQDAFMRTLRNYAARYAYGNVLTADFISVAEEESGRSLSWFFDQWLHQPGFPDLDISWNFTAGADSAFDMTIDIEQRQWRYFQFSFPLMIEIKTKTTVVVDSLWLSDRLNHFRLQITEKPLELIIDPQHALLKQYDIVASPGSAALLPDAFALVQNYPNPFRKGEQTTIIFQAPEKDAPHFVDISIYNILGQKVKILYHQRIAFGIQTLSWDGSDDIGGILPAGLYFIRLSSENSVINNKILFVH